MPTRCPFKSLLVQVPLAMRCRAAIRLKERPCTQTKDTFAELLHLPATATFMSFQCVGNEAALLKVNPETQMVNPKSDRKGVKATVTAYGT